MDPRIILTVIVSYFAFLFVVSWLTTRKADNNSFFIGNKASPWYLVAIGMLGASLSGVTFISVPGWVADSKLYYMQMVLGYLLGYFVIAHILLPVYYRLNLTSIYSYLNERFGNYAYKSGAVLFLISRLIGASFRLFLVANVLQITIFDKMGVPFYVTILLTLMLIWLYTYKGGIKTIVWTDTLQTVFMLVAVILTVIILGKQIGLSFSGIVSTVANSEYGQIFNFGNYKSPHFFVKQFFSGAFITIVMTGLDQDMMQKNLSCRNLKDAQKNMYWYSIAFVPVNLIFLSLGVLLFIFAASNNIPLPERTDDLYPLIATGGYLPGFVGIVFILGLIAAAYSSADSALTALTTCFTVDILNSKNYNESKLRQTRIMVHIIMSVILALIIFFFRILNNESVISVLFKAAGYTYGPLLGLYSLGLLTKIRIRDWAIPIIAVLSPLLTFLLKLLVEHWFRGYKVGYELLIINGLITFLFLLIFRKNPRTEINHRFR